MAISKGVIKSGGSVVFPRTSIDNIVVSTDSATTYIVSNSKIKPDYLISATGTSAGVVYNNDTDHLTITNGGISINTYTTNISGATTAANQKKIPTVSAVQLYVPSYVSTYVNSANVIPTSAVNGLSTTIKNGASSFVQSANVIPQSAVSGLATSLSGKQDALTAGYNIDLTGNTISEKRYGAIETVTSATVTISAGHAYKIDATAGSKTLNAETFDAGNFGKEAHVELFVANAGYVIAGTNMTFVDALEPDAVNNCTIRFHDGHGILSVEDHVEAYLVENTSSTNTAGSLLYGISQTGATYKFIGFKSNLNNSTVPTGGGTATTVKHFVGNGIDVGPTISGGIKLNSNGTFRDCKLNGLVISGGTATLGNVFIDSGTSVSVVSGGSLCIESVVGFGTINLNSTHNYISGTYAYASGCSFTGGSAADGGAFVITGHETTQTCFLTDCTLMGNIAVNRGGAVYIGGNRTVTLSNCTITGNTAGTHMGGGVYAAGSAIITGCTCTNNTSEDVTVDGGTASFDGSTVGTIKLKKGYAVFEGTNNVGKVVNQTGSTSGYVVISSGAIINLTSSINPGGTGGITVSGGTCTVNGNVIASGTYTSINSNGAPT